MDKSYLTKKISIENDKIYTSVNMPVGKAEASILSERGKIFLVVTDSSEEKLSTKMDITEIMKNMMKYVV